MADDEPSDDARPSFDQYPKWLGETHSVNVATERNRYERESVRIKGAAETSPLWLHYLATKQELADTYFAGTTYPLFADSTPESMVIKPWKSFLEKTYRTNISSNSGWPDPPEEGWLLPGNWYERIHDIARTVVVVKYLDGVEAVTNHFQAFVTTGAIADYECNFEARDTGYYAAHSRVGVDFNLLVENWTEVASHGQFEIQVTTQLQEVIRRLTHIQYEGRRMTTDEPAMKWQWDYSSDSFKPNYLGHILHYMEGMIMEVRDKGKKNV